MNIFTKNNYIYGRNFFDFIDLWIIICFENLLPTLQNIKCSILIDPKNFGRSIDFFSLI